MQEHYMPFFDLMGCMPFVTSFPYPYQVIILPNLFILWLVCFTHVTLFLIIALRQLRFKCKHFRRIQRIPKPLVMDVVAPRASIPCRGYRT